MTPEQKSLVLQSWKKLSPKVEAAANLFYFKLFELDPSLKLLFKNDMGEQKRKLMHTLGFAIVNLNSLETLVPVLRLLGKRHGGYGVKDEHYESVGTALLWALEQGLGADFTPEVKQAWTAVYQALAAVMKLAATEAAMTPRVAA